MWFVPGDVRPLVARAKVAALRAVELNDRIAEAHAALSAVYLHEWQFTAAGEAIGRAIRLAPASAWIRHEHSTYLMAMGQTEAGLAEMTKAEELDPLNTAIIADRGNTLTAARRYEEALAQYRRACQLDVTCAPNTSVGTTYLLMGRYSDGIAELQRAHASGAAAADTTTWLAIGHAMAGRTQRAEQLLAELTRISSRQHVPQNVLLRSSMPLSGTETCVRGTRSGAPRPRDHAVADPIHGMVGSTPARSAFPGPRPPDRSARLRVASEP